MNWVRVFKKKIKLPVLIFSIIYWKLQLYYYNNIIILKRTLRLYIII